MRSALYFSLTLASWGLAIFMAAVNWLGGPLASTPEFNLQAAGVLGTLGGLFCWRWIAAVERNRDKN